MSILVTDADEAATLEATLAFVDEWSSPMGVSTAPRCLTPQQKQQQKQQQQQQGEPYAAGPKKPRRKYPNSSSTVLQRRKKAEIVALRVQVAQLETRLEELKHGATQALDVEDTTLLQQKAASGALTYAEQAALQWRGRLQAEKTNTKLRKIMANQLKVSETLRKLLQGTAAMEGMDFLQPEPCRPLVDESACSLALLERSVESLYLEADAVYRPEALQSISVQAMVKHSQSLGKTVEIMSTTPMMCPLKEASDTLWKWFSLSESLGDRPNILERSYALILESQIGTLEFRKQNFVRRYEEADRVVIIWVDTLRLPKYQLQFRNQSWMFITPSADAPKDATVLRSFQQLFFDSEASHPVEEASFARESAFQELSELYRHYLQSQQNVMLNETRSAVMIPGISV